MQPNTTILAGYGPAGRYTHVLYVLSMHMYMYHSAHVYHTPRTMATSHNTLIYMYMYMYACSLALGQRLETQ